MYLTAAMPPRPVTVLPISARRQKPKQSHPSLQLVSSSSGAHTNQIQNVLPRKLTNCLLLKIGHKFKQAVHHKSLLDPDWGTFSQVGQTQRSAKEFLRFNETPTMPVHDYRPSVAVAGPLKSEKRILAKSQGHIPKLCRGLSGTGYSEYSRKSNGLQIY